MEQRRGLLLLIDSGTSLVYVPSNGGFEYTALRHRATSVSVDIVLTGKFPDPPEPEADLIWVCEFNGLFTSNGY